MSFTQIQTVNIDLVTINNQAYPPVGGGIEIVPDVANADVPMLFTTTVSGVVGNLKTGPITYNPSTDTITCNYFTGTAASTQRVIVGNDDTNPNPVYPLWISTPLTDSSEMTSSAGLSYIPSTQSLNVTNLNITNINGSAYPPTIDNCAFVPPNTVFVSSIYGDDGNPGTLEQPVATLTKAISFQYPGPGTYIAIVCFDQSIFHENIFMQGNVNIFAQSAVLYQNPSNPTGYNITSIGYNLVEFSLIENNGGGNPIYVADEVLYVYSGNVQGGTILNEGNYLEINGSYLYSNLNSTSGSVVLNINNKPTGTLTGQINTAWSKSLIPLGAPFQFLTTNSNDPTEYNVSSTFTAADLLKGTISVSSASQLLTFTFDTPTNLLTAFQNNGSQSYSYFKVLIANTTSTIILAPNGNTIKGMLAASVPTTNSFVITVYIDGSNNIIIYT